jgi:hypothetical protein
VNKPNAKIQFSLRWVLILIAIAAWLLYMVDLNSTRILYNNKTASFRFDGFNASLDFDIERLEETLNSKKWRREFAKTYPAHSRLIQNWEASIHGFRINVREPEGSFSKSFAVEVTIPIYVVRKRKFTWNWPPYRDKFYENGEEGVEAKVGKRNGEIYLELLEAVSESVANQMAGE